MLENIFDVLTMSKYEQNVPQCLMILLLISSNEIFDLLKPEFAF